MQPLTDEQIAELNAAGWRPHRSLPWLWVSPDGRYVPELRALEEAEGKPICSEAMQRKARAKEMPSPPVKGATAEGSAAD